MKLNRDLYETYYRKTRELYKQPVLVASVEVILSVFSIAFMILFAIKPTLSIVANLQKQIEDQKTFEQKIDSKISSLNQAQISLTKNADRLPLYTLAVPYEHNLDGLAQRIELLAQENSVAVKSLQFTAVSLFSDGSSGVTLKSAEGVSDGPTSEVVVSFNFEGKSDSLLKMLEGVQNIDRLVDIESVTMSKKDKGKVNQPITASGKAKIFYGKYLNSKQK